jgi:hypothetical protein
MMLGAFTAASVMEIPAKTSLNTLFNQRMDEQRTNRPFDGFNPDLLHLLRTRTQTVQYGILKVKNEKANIIGKFLINGS